MTNILFNAKDSFYGAMESDTTIDLKATAGLSSDVTLGGASTTTFKCNTIIRGSLQLVADTNQEIDLNALTGIDNVAAVLTDVRAIMIKHSGYTTSAKTVVSATNIVVGGATAGTDTFVGFVGDATDTVKVFTGESIVFKSLKNGVTIPVGADKIKVTNPSTTETVFVEYMIAGVKA
jgi:hypothetical protein